MWDKIEEAGKLYGKRKKKTPKQSKKQRKLKKRKAVEGYAQEHTKEPTQAEKAFAKILKTLNFQYEPQKVISFNGDMFIADFYLPKYSTVIEIDGEYHQTPEQRKKDRKRTRTILKNNQVSRLLRFTNDQALGDKTEITWRLLTALMPQVARLFDKHTMQASAVWK